MKNFLVKEVPFGGGGLPALICGPCVIESEEHTLMLAGRIKEIAAARGLGLIFKASFDKANRSSHTSYRGPGLEEGLRILGEAKQQLGLPILTDIHTAEQALPVAEVADIIQVPAFLARQTDLLTAAGQASAKTGAAVNVKKGQFMAPEDMTNVIAKLEAAGCGRILLTDRGTSFGYRMLVSDFRALPIMRAMGYPVCYDATHSVQLPGGAGNASGGRSEMVPYLARAAAAVGIDALFIEKHNDPASALSDGPNALPLDQLDRLLAQVAAICQGLTALE